VQPLDTKRHDALFKKEEFTLPVHLIGTGGVGSHVAYELAKLGVGFHNEIHLYDGDTIESHNIANQAFEVGQIGMQKALALSDRYVDLSGGATVHAHPSFVTERITLSGVVFLCLDSMEARKKICQGSLWRNTAVPAVIDTRMDAATAVAYTIDPNNEEHIERWEERWFPDEEADNLAGCGGHLSVITAVAMTASIAVQQFIGFAAKRNIATANYFRLSLDSWESCAEHWS
jgi:molybdopterin/thiamine biosynthesis adenylyltransferase